MSEAMDQGTERAWKTGGILYVSSPPQRALIRVLSIADRRGLDAGALVSYLAGEFPGSTGQRMSQLATALANGMPVIDALEQTPGVLNRSIVMALRLANQSGAMSEMYDALLDDHEIDDPGVGIESKNPLLDFGRIATSFFFVLVLVTFLMVAVIPTFEQIFEEFGLQIPAPAKLLIAWSNWMANYWFLVFALGLMVMGVYLAFRASMIGSALRPSNWGRRLVTRSVNVVSLLAIAAQSGQPISSGVATLARLHHLPRTRRRLQNAHQRMEKGEEPWRSLAAERLISRREADALAVTGSGATQAWLLGFNANRRVNRSTMRGHLAIRTVSLMCTIVLGVIVAWSAVSVFMVLYSLVSGLS